MDKIRTNKLFKDHPLFLRGRTHSIRDNLMPFGMECGPGWYPLLKKVFDVAEEECQRQRRLGVLVENLPIAVQVKEKFGTLRIYAHGCTNEIYAAIEEAEGRSATMCEQCGATSCVNGNGWLSTICNACREKRKKEDDLLTAARDMRVEKAKRLTEMLEKGYLSGQPEFNRQQRAKALLAIFSEYCPTLQSRVTQALVDKGAVRDVREVAELLRKLKRKAYPGSGAYYLEKLLKSLRASRRPYRSA